ncbi:MAG: DNA mismatch repair endonuclease MutL [Proteobacteria bacterium]|nr:DNA mismatch repair endonuclease MutL [Pseudomonadota bacterium]MBU2226967.1 DNA mismatch repair endonuclease MutL [Pseudomonadota bacterium]MBU2261772.1 DNA mismatch repair endonuclease MutL [Pseudomonadota bacterium]
MSGKIIVLPETLTSRIAAGEVVERPASIVKELLENALDAGATEIAVELEKGGCQSIRVTDNGEGIGREEVALAFARYATSKIGTFEDIYRVSSFGFRGEALPSIASISRVEMVTRQAFSPAGTRIVVEGGEERGLTDAGCPVGTSIAVSRIFEQVPVRRKFLKGDLTEQGYCLDWITRLALADPEVKMKVTAGGRMVMNIPAAKDLSERIALTLGRDFRGQLIPAAGERGGVRLQGFVSRPEFTRSGASQMFFYVNRRFVKDYLLNHAAMTAYRRVIEARRYPVLVLSLDMPPGEVDVNVHPAKLEVRFRNPRDIYALVVETLSGVIGAGHAPGLHTGASGGGDAGRAAYAARVEEALKRYRVSSGPEKLIFGGAPAQKRESAPPPVAREPEPGAEQPEMRPLFSALAYLGQVAGTYLVFAGGEGLVLVDQHAAHERILFEKLRRQAAETGERAIGQRLLLPEVVSLPPRDLAFVTGSVPILEEAGMEVEPFGGDSVVVKALPAFLPYAEAKTLLGDLLADCGEEARDLPLVERRERIFTALACRGAVKANRILNPQEVAALCLDLDAIPQAATCPHGRPLAVPVSLFELEKMFKRR